MSSDRPSPPRERGRPKTTELERLRTSLTFFSMKTVSRLSLRKLERQYLSDCDPARLERLTEESDDFERYARGERSPRKREIPGSPLEWALAKYPSVARTYESLLFTAIQSSYEPEALTRLSLDLWKSNPLVPQVIFATFGGCHPIESCLSLWLPIGICPIDIVGFSKRLELDALVALVIALKTNVGTPGEEQCALLVVEWVQNWTKSENPPTHLVSRLVRVLSEHVPELSQHFSGLRPWTSLRADINHPCFARWP